VFPEGATARRVQTSWQLFAQPEQGPLGLISARVRSDPSFKTAWARDRKFRECSLPNPPLVL